MVNDKKNIDNMISLILLRKIENNSAWRGKDDLVK